MAQEPDYILEIAGRRLDGANPPDEITQAEISPARARNRRYISVH